MNSVVVGALTEIVNPVESLVRSALLSARVNVYVNGAVLIPSVIVWDTVPVPTSDLLPLLLFIAIVSSVTPGTGTLKFRSRIVTVNV